MMDRLSGVVLGKGRVDVGGTSGEGEERVRM